MNKIDYRSELDKYSRMIVQFEDAFDNIMAEPAGKARERKLAKLINKLTLRNQVTMRGALGYSLNEINKIYGIED